MAKGSRKRRIIEYLYRIYKLRMAEACEEYDVAGMYEGGAFEEIYGTWDEVIDPTNCTLYDGVNQLL